MFQKVLHASTVSWLRKMMDITFLTCFWYLFLTLKSTLEGGGSSNLSIMPKCWQLTNNIEPQLSNIGIESMNYFKGDNTENNANAH